MTSIVNSDQACKYLNQNKDNVFFKSFKLKVQ
jgi:hypothetical protein